MLRLQASRNKNGETRRVDMLSPELTAAGEVRGHCCRKTTRKQEKKTTLSVSAAGKVRGQGTRKTKSGQNQTWNMFLIILFCQWGESGAAAFPSDPSRCVSMWTGADRWSPEGFPSRSDQISVFKSFLSIWARRISSVDHQQITADPCWLFCLSQAGPSRRWVRATLRRTSDTFPPAGTEPVWFLRSVGLRPAVCCHGDEQEAAHDGRPAGVHQRWAETSELFLQQRRFVQNKLKVQTQV